MLKVGQVSIDSYVPFKQKLTHDQLLTEMSINYWSSVTTDVSMEFLSWVSMDYHCGVNHGHWSSLSIQVSTVDAFHTDNPEYFNSAV